MCAEANCCSCNAKSVTLDFNTDQPTGDYAMHKFISYLKMGGGGSQIVAKLLGTFLLITASLETYTLSFLSPYPQRAS